MPTHASGIDHQIPRRPILNQWPTIPVEQQSAWRLDRIFPQTIGFRFAKKSVALYDLQPRHPPQQNQEREAEHDDHDPSALVALDLVALLAGSNHQFLNWVRGGLNAKRIAPSIMVYNAPGKETLARNPPKVFRP